MGRKCAKGVAQWRRKANANANRYGRFVDEVRLCVRLCVCVCVSERANGMAFLEVVYEGFLRPISYGVVKLNQTGKVVVRTLFEIA